MSKEKLISIINDTIDKCENEYKWMIDNETSVTKLIFVNTASRKHYNDCELLGFLDQLKDKISELSNRIKVRWEMEKLRDCCLITLTVVQRT